MFHTAYNNTIAKALIGVWRLREYSDVTEGVAAHYPFGEDPDGLLIYTPDGFVSALLMSRCRPNVSGNGFRDGTPDQYSAAGKDFIGYTGRYDVDEARLVVTHRPTVAFAPNMIGSVQQRLVDLQGDVLVLTAQHVQAAGLPATQSRLVWVRERKGEAMTEAEVRRVHTESFYGALKTSDFATLERLYSERYMLVRSDGSVLSKQQVLGDLRDQGLAFGSIELEREEIRVFGSVAILTGESRTVSSRDGETTRTHFRLIAVYVEEEATIRLAHFQSTDMPE